MLRPLDDHELSHDIKNAKILIVDDEIVNVKLLQHTLQRWGYTNLQCTTNPLEAVALFQADLPDIVLLDLMMPQVDGFAFMAKIKPVLPPRSYLPVIVLTADNVKETKLKALKAGAKDFLTKPFNQAELLLRVGNLLETRLLYQEREEQNQRLEKRVHERTLELEDSRQETLERLAQAAEFRDDDTGQHTQRVGKMAARLGSRLGMKSKEVELLAKAAPLHDVGKIGIPDSILLKPGKLTSQEFHIMQTHTTIGATLLAKGRSPLMEMAEVIARTHHERWDGTGYPCGLKGNGIPLVGRIVSIVDVFDALTHERPYKKAWPLSEAIAEITNQRDRQFDPQVVEAFLRTLHGCSESS